MLSMHYSFVTCVEYVSFMRHVENVCFVRCVEYASFVRHVENASFIRLNAQVLQGWV